MFAGTGFHYYHQIEQSDCGVTCLRMVARHFGRKIPVKFLRSRADLSRGGISVRGLKECAESIGMKGYGVKLGSRLLVEAPLPAILHWNQNHFAVLWKVSKGRYFVADPAAGMMVYSREEFDAHFCGDGERGIALILAPTEEFHSISFPTDDSRGKIFRSLRDSIREHCSTYLLILSLALLTLTGLVWEGWMLRRRRSVDYDIRTIQCRNNNNVYELVNGISDLKIHNAHHHRVSLWRTLQERLNRLRRRSENIRLIQGGGASLLYQSRDLAITGLCATLVIGDTMTLGTMVTVAFVTGRLATGFSSISSSLSSLQQTSIALDRSNDVMDEPADTTEGKIDSLDGDIILRDVTYKYPGSDSQPVIGGLGLTIPRGKTTAIVGPSGCGKSTLMKLLQGLYHPQQGSITAGMVDVATLQPQEWGKICTSVSQQGYIFSDSIARNIALGDESPDMERVADAARTACLGTLLDKLPLKLHTLIGPSGMELSGGERQRLMIARAVYRDTPVILLDEATSSLDAETERRIVANLSGFGQGRTMVIAAHRLSTVSNADLILFMDSGRIIEQGTHSSLMSLGGRYASFVSGQLTS